MLNKYIVQITYFLNNNMIPAFLQRVFEAFWTYFSPPLMTSLIQEFCVKIIQKSSLNSNSIFIAIDRHCKCWKKKKAEQCTFELCQFLVNLNSVFFGLVWCRSWGRRNRNKYYVWKCGTIGDINISEYGKSYNSIVNWLGKVNLLHLIIPLVWSNKFRFY